MTIRLACCGHLYQKNQTCLPNVPGSLGYGARGQGPIGPNETLIFKVELLDVNPSDEG